MMVCKAGVWDAKPSKVPFDLSRQRNDSAICYWLKASPQSSTYCCIIFLVASVRFHVASRAARGSFRQLRFF